MGVDRSTGRPASLSVTADTYTNVLSDGHEVDHAALI